MRHPPRKWNGPAGSSEKEEETRVVGAWKLDCEFIHQQETASMSFSLFLRIEDAVILHLEVGSEVKVRIEVLHFPQPRSLPKCLLLKTCSMPGAHGSNAPLSSRMNECGISPSQTRAYGAKVDS